MAAAAELEAEKEIPPAQKTHTIAHMNKDHRADMRHILLHYGSVPAAPCSWRNPEGGGGREDSDPVMLDIDLSCVKLGLPGSDNNTVYSVAFDPPLAAWSERRARLVEMTRVARAALGVTTDPGEGAGGGVVVVNEYMPPRVPYDAAIAVAVLVYFVSFALVRMGCAAPGGLLARGVEAVRFPGGVGGFTWLVDVIFVPVLGIHLFEAWWLERTRLQRFGVRRGSRVWWLWMGSVFVEGAMAFKRFDIVVERLRGEGKKGR
ncbi:hypothetical protein C8A01DRAFT_46326 [Parachaetomium inaequale]|uniref:DUF2470 domain-containing protein n=1 Tax=Parachaetomium inaequale TaxID=2588326 RepID=A0AAN6SSF7_9PEZI|nr:hypothetical protein C8A01DRAFT_46326 [Parachaetomium inaequale]